MRVKIPLQIIELEPDSYHIMVSSVFADGQKANWIIDTGASKTVFDKNLIRYYTVLEGESDEIHTAAIGDHPQEISIGDLFPSQLGKLEIKNLKVALLDLSHINTLYARSTNIEICGLIGSDFLMRFRARIDYEKQVLILKNRKGLKFSASLL